MQTLNTLKLLNLPDLYGNSPQIYECYWSICKKLGKSFVSKNVVIGSAASPPVWVVALEENTINLKYY